MICTKHSEPGRERTGPKLALRPTGTQEGKREASGDGGDLDTGSSRYRNTVDLCCQTLGASLSVALCSVNAIPFSLSARQPFLWLTLGGSTQPPTLIQCPLSARLSGCPLSGIVCWHLRDKLSYLRKDNVKTKGEESDGASEHHAGVSCSLCHLPLSHQPLMPSVPL